MIEVRRLRPEDDRTAFASGNVDLDRFFQNYAGQNQFRHYVGTTYVAVEQLELLGYVTVAATSIVVEDLPDRLRKRLPKYPLPALRIARLGVAKSAQGQGVGKRLLRAAFHIAHEMSKLAGCCGVLVDAKPEAVAFYEQFGFESLQVIQGELGDRPAPKTMFLPLGSIPAEQD
ncbi:MAG: GNAT family N-acetyltransferase [Planctomycetota bacterium]|nr:GNAT family N-acetyltransferase [Planctomycetota bacterium]